MTRSWPPFVGARVRNTLGDVFVVTAHHWNRELGEFIVVRRLFPGGWECLPVTPADWFGSAYHLAR